MGKADEVRGPDRDRLNPAQRRAVEHGAGPLLIIAGAGSGKTHTLAHRVARLILDGADPRRVLLLTFTRRAAAEMTRRARRICAGQARAPARGRRAPAADVRWSGTFHAIGNRLLRMHAASVGLDPSFTVLDRSDSADLMDVERGALGLAAKGSRFPRKATCLSIYSHVVNAQCPVAQTLESSFPWCESWEDELRGLFSAYVQKKQKLNVLDYDDLLLYWHLAMGDADVARRVAERFDHVLVDEYQDTNALQAGILRALKPDGQGLTVVGDDAQSIYSFRAARVRNILEFPAQFEPPATVVTLEQNYRSTQPILAACNAVMEPAQDRFAKDLFSDRVSHQKPTLVTAEDENAQVDYVVERILEHREAGIALKKQAVLMRTAHHSDLLEVELGRRDIPFVKYGGLKFLEAAHVKDVLGILRWAENPRDAVAAFRVVQLLPGIGPGIAARAVEHLEAGAFDLATLARFRAPAAAAADWPSLCTLLVRLHDARTDWQGQLGAVRRWYEPWLERLYDAAHVRVGDLEQLEQISGAYPSRERFLTELTLDPPAATGDEAGPPHLDEDFLILSTIHSAKGQEWDVVYTLNAADGCIPSDMSTGSPEQVEEERRLLYVAMTRARDHLHVVHPLRFFVRQQHRHGDRHLFAPRTRFIPESVARCFERRAAGHVDDVDDLDGGQRGSPTRGQAAGRTAPRVDVGARVRDMWR
ncbi:MAG: ATP-dependent helicase [Deltaproteobacteria bacterium]|nr:ATP-dependent helicase [Deltaproteobacteria bacterium]